MLPKQSAGLEFAPELAAGRDQFRGADVISKTERPAAQGREAGTEDHPVIGVLGRGHDLFFEAAGGFVVFFLNNAERNG
ncbi:MAG: hypothetical protein M3429_06300, partial [Verrucomicrobiota bacterium]|nr:hypothetical protein [Verrucomicrobiota bacterium]